jgi:ADP-dependent NAD(P)H-hydrate dehydratase
MSSSEATTSVEVGPALLAEWSLPDPGSDKKARGDVVVVGGSRRTPGGVTLAAEAALRVGAGRIAAVVPRSIDAQLGAVLPEAAIHALPDDASEPLADAEAAAVAGAGAVLVGPGFDDIDETEQTLRAVGRARAPRLILDAYALGALTRIERSALPDVLVLTPNREELEILLGRSADERRDEGALVDDVRAAARRYRAVVTCYGAVADPGGATWSVPGGGPSLATSGSGDVLSGAVAGFLARGVEPARAAVWATWVHARAGKRLQARLGLGGLARELAAELPHAVLDALERRHTES